MRMRSGSIQAEDTLTGRRSLSQLSMTSVLSIGCRPLLAQFEIAHEEMPPLMPPIARQSRDGNPPHTHLPCADPQPTTHKSVPAPNANSHSLQENRGEHIFRNTAASSTLFLKYLKNEAAVLLEDNRPGVKHRTLDARPAIIPVPRAVADLGNATETNA